MALSSIIKVKEMDANKKSSKLPKKYDPLIDEGYMSPDMLRYFKNKLERMLKNQSVMEELHNGNFKFEEDYLTYREIEESLKLIETGGYGYCLKTGKPIGVARLELSPIIKYISGNK
jgi:hypothetical protein